MFNKAKGILGILFILSAVAIIFYWENYGREELLYKNVMIAKENIYKNETLTEENVMVAKVEDTFITEEVALENAQIIGKESKQFIPQNAIVDMRYVGEPELLIHVNEYIMQLPNDWIEVYPDSLRRGDHIFLYPVFNFTDEYTTEACINTVPVTKLVVAYVKDSGNREVIDVDQKKLERYDGTSTIDSIEVIISFADTEKLLEFYKNGYKFIILYQ